MLESTEKGGVRNSIHNCLTVFQYDPVLSGAVAKNLLTERIDLLKPIGKKRRTGSKAMTDTDMKYIRLYLEDTYGLTSEKKIADAADLAADANSYHPIRDYLSGLVWDGKERIRYCLRHFLGADTDNFTYHSLRLFLLGAIHRAFCPGCKFEVMLCLVGGQGAGKSTFSRCFCGLEKRCGEVIWNGRTYRPKDRLNTCYMVMQEVNHQLFTETVLDEVLISMEEKNQEWAEEILAELDLIGFKDRHPMSLSGGQKQRVAIASAIASKRSILFFDEPTSGLDYKHMKEVANVLKQVRDAGITLYVITHDLELLLDCCTDIVHFEDGSIIDKFQMDEAGLEKIRNYFIKGVPTK